MLNTSLIEPFNGTMRERLASLTRKCRHGAHGFHGLETGMYLIGCTDNLCLPHHELSWAKHFGFACPPAMAAALADHICTIQQVVTYKRVPVPWTKPKPVGKRALGDPTLPKRPRARPRKHPIADPTLPKPPRGRPRKLACLSSFTS